MKIKLVNGAYTHITVNGKTYKHGAIKEVATKKEAIEFLTAPGNSTSWGWWYDHKKLGMTSAEKLLNNRGIK